MAATDKTEYIIWINRDGAGWVKNSAVSSSDKANQIANGLKAQARDAGKTVHVKITKERGDASPPTGNK